MKLLVFVTFFIVAGFNIAQSTSGINESFGLQFKAAPSEKRKVVRRVVRNAFNGMANGFMMQIEATIKSACKANGHEDIAINYQDIFDELVTCLSKKSLYITPKDEFVDNIDACSQKVVKEMKNCMEPELKNFPGFLLDLAKSVTSFMYDDIDYMKNELAECLPRLSDYEVQRSYIQCLSDVLPESHGSVLSQFPKSKESFCKTYLPVSHCFMNMLKETCDISTNFDKFEEGYINAQRVPCEKEDS